MNSLNGFFFFSVSERCLQKRYFSCSSKLSTLQFLMTVDFSVFLEHTTPAIYKHNKITTFKQAKKMCKFEGTMILINLSCIFLALKIANVNWQSKLNKAAHHTSDYSSTEIILRRGQAFSITLNLQTSAQPEDNLTFIASTGNSPMALTSHPRHSSSKTLVTCSSAWSQIGQGQRSCSPTSHQSRVTYSRCTGRCGSRQV